MSPCCSIQAVISIALLLSVVKSRPTEREGGGGGGGGGGGNRGYFPGAPKLLGGTMKLLFS